MDDNTIKRQLEIPSVPYQYAEDLQLELKRETGKKPPIYEILVDFIVEGAKTVKAKREGGSSDDIEVAANEDVSTWNQVTQYGTLMSLAKTNLNDLKLKIVSLVEEGYADPVEAIARIAAFEKIFIGDQRKPGVKKMLLDKALEELDRNNGKIMIGNLEVAKAESGVRYDCSHDPVWSELNERLELAKEKLKNRELFLKGVKSPDPIKGIEPQTELHGDELIELRPPVKKSTTTVKVSLK